MNSPQITNFGAAAAQLANAPRALNAGLRRAARLWGTKALKVAKAKAPALRNWTLMDGKKYPTLGASLALKKSLGTKVTTNKRTGQITVIIGARYGKNITVAIPRTGKTIQVNPTRYIHLVEKGFLAKLFRSGKRVWVPGKHFMQAAEDATRGDATAITADCLNSALLKIQSSGGI